MIGMPDEERTQMTVGRCRTARDTVAIPGVWSMGERLLVALVLGRDGDFAEMGYGEQEAHERMFGDLPVPMTPREYVVWLNDLRTSV